MITLFQVNGAMIHVDPDDTGDFRNADPGFEIELYPTDSLPAMTSPWMGLLTVKTKMHSGQRKLLDDEEIIRKQAGVAGIAALCQAQERAGGVEFLALNYL